MSQDIVESYDEKTVESSKERSSEDEISDSMFKIRDERRLKKEYYMSHPLRSYGQLKGESILPSRFKKQLFANLDETDLSNETNSKRELPKEFTELKRDNMSFVGNRRFYKEWLRSSLNLSSNLDEVGFLRSYYPKSQVAALESSRKIYNELCKLNITKPVHVDEVESILKKTILTSSNKSLKAKCNENDMAKLITPSATLLSFGEFIQAQSMHLQANEERFQTVARKSTNTNLISPYQRVESNTQHKGAIFNYRQAVKEAIKAIRQSSMSRSASSSSDSASTKYEIVVYEPPSNRNEKHLERVRLAREKVLNATVQRMNLNKMTILQPFEQTKILVNIDKVPSHMWTRLFSKNYDQPKYLIPPVHAYGYFKSIPSDNSSNKSDMNKIPKPNSAELEPVLSLGNNRISGKHN